jgi:integrase
VIRNTMLPLRVIFGRAVSRGEVGINPVDNVKIPAVRTKSDRVASPEEAAQLLAVLPAADRPLWATALYAGLRLGELMALRWEDVDLGAGKLRVSRSWDPKEGMIEPKSRASVRTVPIATVLRDYLTEHRMDSTGEGLVFGRSESKPFGYWVIRRSIKRWEGLGLEPITPHAARHTFAALMIAAGVNAKALSTYMGHANIAVTYDRYGHLMPGSEEEAAGLLDAYLERAVTDAPLDRLPD